MTPIEREYRYLITKALKRGDQKRANELKARAYHYDVDVLDMEERPAPEETVVLKAVG